MPIDRRTALKAGSLAGAAAALPAAARSATGAALVVHDSRLAESEAFLAAQSGSRLDIAREDAARWPLLRAGAPRHARIEGLTRWSDWVQLRSELEARGYRTAGEIAAGAPRDHLFRWTMRRRLTDRAG